MNSMKCIIMILATCLTTLAIGQDRAEYLRQYEKNIKREYLNDVYIPADIEEAIVELKELGDDGALNNFQRATEDQISRSLHFGLGRWISVKWNLLDGSRYSHYLRSMGISHPDDMVEFTIVSLHRDLNGVDQDLEGRAAAFKQRRLEMLKESKKRH